MSALNKFVGKVAQQAAAEAVAKEAQLQRKNILLAGGLVAFGGYVGSLCVRLLLTIAPTTIAADVFCTF
jgi:hypothetical protein